MLSIDKNYHKSNKIFCRRHFLLMSRVYSCFVNMNYQTMIKNNNLNTKYYKNKGIIVINVYTFGNYIIYILTPIASHNEFRNISNLIF